MFPFSAIVLIGMSGIGKTTNAEKYGEKTTWNEARQKMRESGNFLYISADNEIFFRLKDKGELLDTELAYKKEHEKEPVDFLAEYVGKFEGEKTSGEFFRRQKLYSDAEEEDLRALPYLLRSAYEEHPRLPHPILYDTTGSFCEVLRNRSHPLYRELTKYARIVYLECSKKEEEILLQRQVERPKPMVYNRGCFEEWLSDYQRQNSVAEEDIVPDDFLRFVFPKAIAYRRARYEELADVVVSTIELKALPQGNSSSVFANAFIALVKEKLSSRPPPTRSRAHERQTFSPATRH